MYVRGLLMYVRGLPVGSPTRPDLLSNLSDFLYVWGLPVRCPTPAGTSCRTINYF